MEDLNIGKKLGNYRIVRFIGEGGMSRVYEAKHEKFERRYAIKVLIPELTVQASVRWRFENEARVMDMLSECRDIINVFDFYEEDKFLAIIMEMLEGETLKDRIKKGAMDDASVKEIFPRVLDAFKYAHDKNIVHRDVKPSNIFLLNNGEIRVLDFGIAKISDSKEDNTSTGTQMGTTIYMSPEQVLDSKHLDYRSDIYSLGVMLYHCLTGQSPYNTETVSRFEIQIKIVNEPLAEIENIPEPYRSIIKRSTAKKPGDRYQSCEEMKHAIIEAKIEKAQIVNSDKAVPDEVKVYNKEAEKKPETKKDDEKTELYVENVVKKELEYESKVEMNENNQVLIGEEEKNGKRILMFISFAAVVNFCAVVISIFYILKFYKNLL